MKKKTKRFILGAIKGIVIGAILAAAAVFLMSVFDKGLSGEFLRNALKIIGIGSGSAIGLFSIIGGITCIVQGSKNMDRVRALERGGSSIRHTKVIEKNVDLKRIDNEVTVAKAVETNGVNLSTEIGAALASTDMTVVKNALIKSGAYVSTVVKHEQQVAAHLGDIKKGIEDTTAEYAKEIPTK